MGEPACLVCHFYEKGHNENINIQCQRFSRLIDKFHDIIPAHALADIIVSYFNKEFADSEKNIPVISFEEALKHTRYHTDVSRLEQEAYDSLLKTLFSP